MTSRTSDNRFQLALNLLGAAWFGLVHIASCGVYVIAGLAISMTVWGLMNIVLYLGSLSTIPIPFFWDAIQYIATEFWAPITITSSIASAYLVAFKTGGRSKIPVVTFVLFASMMAILLNAALFFIGGTAAPDWVIASAGDGELWMYEAYYSFARLGPFGLMFVLGLLFSKRLKTLI